MERDYMQQTIEKNAFNTSIPACRMRSFDQKLLMVLPSIEQIVEQNQINVDTVETLATWKF